MAKQEPSSPGKKSFHRHVERALKKGGTLHIHYKKLNGRTVKRKIDPHSMRGNTLVAYDHKRKAIRSFRMERVKHMEKAAVSKALAERAGRAASMKSTRNMLRSAMGGPSSLVEKARKAADQSTKFKRYAMKKSGAFLGFGKPKAPKEEPKLSDHHVQQIMPHFKKHEEARKLRNEKKISDEEYGDRSMDFVNAFDQAERESGVPNERIYSHMYANHGYDREKTAFWRGFQKAAGEDTGLTRHEMLKRGLITKEQHKQMGHVEHHMGRVHHHQERAEHHMGLLASAAKPQEKQAGLGEHLTHAAELGGLGILAHDSIKDWNSSNPEVRSKARKEGVGLGVLALPSVHHFGSMAANALRRKA